MIQKAPEHSNQLLRQHRRAIVQLVIIVVALVIFVPQFSEFKNSWSYISDSHPLWIVGGLGAVLSTVFFASLVYIALLPTKLPLARTALIQLATYFTNRLLPSGLGGIGFNALYISKQTNISKTDSAVYATANNIVGFVAFWLCAFFSSIIADSKIKLPGFSVKSFIVVLTIGLLVIALSFLFNTIKKNVLNFAGHMWGVLIALSKAPVRVSFALLASMGITVSYVTILWCASRATGANIGITDLFIAFMAGNAALSVSPTPGGLGAVEAAMTAILVGGGNSPSLSLATVLMFRIMSYWLPILPGYIAFRTATKQDYV